MKIMQEKDKGKGKLVRGSASHECGIEVDKWDYIKGDVA